MSWLSDTLGSATNGLQSTFNSGVDSLMGKPSQQTSGPVEVPGIIGRPQAAGLLNQATGLTGQTLPGQALLDSLIKNPSTTSYTQPLYNAINNPNMSPVGVTQNALVQQAMNARQGSMSALGIGASPATQSAVTAAAAPTLENLHQQVVQNLQTAENSAQQVNQARMTAVLQQLQQQLASKGIDINALLQAASEGKPQVANAAQGTGQTPGFLSTLTNSISNLTGGSGSTSGAVGMVTG